MAVQIQIALIAICALTIANAAFFGHGPSSYGLYGNQYGKGYGTTYGKDYGSSYKAGSSGEYGSYKYGGYGNHASGDNYGKAASYGDSNYGKGYGLHHQKPYGFDKYDSHYEPHYAANNYNNLKYSKPYY